MPKAVSTKRLPLENLLLNIRSGSARLRLENSFISHVLRGKVSSLIRKYMGLSSLRRGFAAGNPTVPVSKASFNSD